MIDKKKIVWAIISFCIAVGSIFLVINQSKTFKAEVLISSMLAMDLKWLILAVVSMLGFIWFEGLAIIRIAKALGVNRELKNGMVYSAADVCFSAITPSASGGQPASAYFMMKDGMKGSAIAITLLLNLIMYSAALLSVGGLTFLLFHKILFQLSMKFKILFLIGFGIICVLTFVFYMLLHKDKLIYRICNTFICFFEKLNIIKDGSTKREKLKSSLKQYRECAKFIAEDKSVLLHSYLLNVLQRLSQLGVPFFIFMACGKGSFMALRAMVIQCFVAVGSNSFPIPGAMGVADYMMLDGFTNLLGNAEAVNMELICRGITFYGCVIAGGVITMAGYILRMKRQRKNQPFF